MIHQCLARANCSAPSAESDIALVRKHGKSTTAARRNVVNVTGQWIEVDMMIYPEPGRAFR